MEIVLIIAAFIVGILFEKFHRWETEEDCPKLYLGYNRCNGASCDHSREAWRAATAGKDEETNYWHNRS